MGDQVILLDLRRTKYVGIGGPHVAALAMVIDDWPIAGNDGSAGVDPARLSDSIVPLLRQHLLTDAAVPALPKPRLAEPDESLDAPDDCARRGIEWRQLFRLWRASALSSRWLRHRNLSEIALAVAQMRNGSTAGGPTSEAQRRAVQAYMRARPFAFTAHDRCLHDSLALVLFLAAERQFPRWVIGVRTRPFGAHSWVQSGRVVLNDLHENVRGYCPILVV